MNRFGEVFERQQVFKLLNYKNILAIISVPYLIAFYFLIIGFYRDPVDLSPGASEILNASIKSYIYTLSDVIFKFLLILS